MYTVPQGRNFRGTGSRSDQCSVKARVNKKVLSQGIKRDTQSLIRTVCDSEFQTDGAEEWKACPLIQQLGQYRE